MAGHVGERRERTDVTMPYVIVRESYINNSCVVDGLPSNEVRLITEKVRPPPIIGINDATPARVPGGKH